MNVNHNIFLREEHIMFHYNVLNEIICSQDKWGRPNNSRFECCLLWVDADLHVLDNYVNERVDCMINDGLLDEVCNIYNPDAVYTQGLRQAIGVREFDEFFRLYVTKKEPHEINTGSSTTMVDLHDDRMKCLLDEAVSQLKANTRRLVRRQVNTNSCVFSVLAFGQKII
jgi:tRNA dimethylallyltransferase